MEKRIVSSWRTAFLLFVFLLTMPAYAAVDEIKADVSSVSVEVGNTILYQVTINGSGNLPTPTVNLPSSFQIVSGPNSNISMQFINNKMSSTRTLTYRLRAMRKGSFTITGPTVTSKGKQFTGNSITIAVTGPDGSGSQKSSTSNATPSSPQRSIKRPATQRNKDLPPIFLEANVSSQSVMFQEPIVLTFTLYYQPQVSTYNVNRLASTEGFWSEEWSVPRQPDVHQEYVEGQLYNVADIHRLILFPTKTGELTIGPMEITLQYTVAGRNRSNSLFDSFFDPFSGGRSVRNEDVASDPITIMVAPLPAQGRPVDFENVVGKYRITSQMDQDTVRTNESVTFKVTISGEGNIGFIPTPQVTFPSDLEVYEPQIEEEHHPENGAIVGEKSFTWLLIPRRAGKQNIPSVSFSYFDPETKQYRTRQSPAKILQVLPATGWTGVDTDQSDTPSEVETLGTDIRWILPAERGLRRHGPPLQEQPLYWLAYLLPIGVAVAGFALRKRQDKMLSQEGLVRSRKAAKRAFEALALARNLLAKGEIQEGYTGLARGILGYISDRIGVPVGQLDRQRLLSELGQRAVSESSVRELIAILDLCDSARFTPQGAEASSLAELIERAQRWIGQVDRSLALERS